MSFLGRIVSTVIVITSITSVAAITSITSITAATVKSYSLFLMLTIMILDQSKIFSKCFLFSLSRRERRKFLFPPKYLQNILHSPLLEN